MQSCPIYAIIFIHCWERPVIFATSAIKVPDNFFLCSYHIVFINRIMQEFFYNKQNKLILFAPPKCGSNSFYYSNIFVEKAYDITKTYNQKKFILIIRDPIERFISAYLYACISGNLSAADLNRNSFNQCIYAAWDKWEAGERDHKKLWPDTHLIAQSEFTKSCNFPWTDYILTKDIDKYLPLHVPEWQPLIQNKSEIKFNYTPNELFDFEAKECWSSIHANDLKIYQQRLKLVPQERFELPTD